MSKLCVSIYIVLAYVFFIFGSIPITRLWSDRRIGAIKHLLRSDKGDEEPTRDPNVPRVTGILERLIIMTLIGWNVAGAPAFIGTWILAKSAGGWAALSKKQTVTEYDRALVMVGLQGSAMSVLLALIGGLILQQIIKLWL